MTSLFSATPAKRGPQVAPAATFSHPTWASARKDMVGASLGSSRLWFTIAEGVVSEVYYPRIDIPQIKDLGFIIADDKDFWVELRRLDSYAVSLASPGAPAVEIVHRHPRFIFTLQVCPSQRRDVLLLRFRLEGDAALRPYALLSARLGGDAANNVASVAATTAGPRCGRNRARSAWRCWRPTNTGRTPGARLRSAAKRRATAGRTSIATGA